MADDVPFLMGNNYIFHVKKNILVNVIPKLPLNTVNVIPKFALVEVGSIYKNLK